MNNFLTLGVSPAIVKSLEELAIRVPTEIQEKVIPTLLEKKTDLLAQAQTGTGKTLAFALPILQKITSGHKHIQALILCPTRELCQQTAKVLFKCSKHSEKLFVEAVFGGVDITKQVYALSRPTHVLVATPGRLRELLEKKAVNLSGIHTCVVDEVDEMLAMGFQKDIDKILHKTNDFRKIWMFSATVPQRVQELVNTYLEKGSPAIRLKAKETVNPGIEHQYVRCNKEDKTNLLFSFLKDMGGARGVVFCRTKGDAQHIAKQLLAKNIATDALHGDLTQKERDRVMRLFHNKTIKCLVATDMAARGIDVEDLAYILHYNLPDQPEFYTHRAGRTARAGKKGISLAFITPQDERKFNFLQQLFSLDFIQIR